MDIVSIDKFFRKAYEHARYPQNHGALDKCNGHARITGPCGDTMEFWVWIDPDQTVRKVSFITDGCGPSLAAGSMTTCLAEGKNIRDARAISQKAVLDALGGLPEDHRHCALLSANTLAAACEDYMKNNYIGGSQRSGK